MSITTRGTPDNYQLAFVEDEGKVVSVAGFIITKALAWDKYLYVDDLVTDSNARSKGYGDKLIDWLMDYAKQNGCQQFHLDSAVHRLAAHRFYFRKRLTISCYHFELVFDDPK